jgi:hypothetical protein
VAIGPQVNGGTHECGRGEDRPVNVGTKRETMLANPAAWFFKKVHQLREPRGPDRGRYLRIVEVATAIPNFANSSRMRGLPQVGFAAHIRRIS